MLRTALAPVLLQMRSVPGLAAQQSEICEDFVSYVRLVRNSKSQAIDNIQDSLYRLALECESSLTPHRSQIIPLGCSLHK